MTAKDSGSLDGTDGTYSGNSGGRKGISSRRHRRQERSPSKLKIRSPDAAKEGMMDQSILLILFTLLGVEKHSTKKREHSHDIPRNARTQSLRLPKNGQDQGGRSNN